MKNVHKHKQKGKGIKMNEVEIEVTTSAKMAEIRAWIAEETGEDPDELYTEKQLRELTLEGF